MKGKMHYGGYEAHLFDAAPKWFSVDMPDLAGRTCGSTVIGRHFNAVAYVATPYKYEAKLDIEGTLVRFAVGARF